MNLQHILTAAAYITTATLAASFIRDLTITTYQAWKQSAAITPVTPQIESTAPHTAPTPQVATTEPTATHPELLLDLWSTTEAITPDNEPSTQPAATFPPQQQLLLPAAKIEVPVQENKPVLEPLDPQLTALTVPQLRKLGGQLGLTRLSGLRKNQLVALVSDRQQQQNNLIKQLYSVAH